MPTWSGILLELQQTATEVARLIQAGQLPPNTSPFDVVRREYMSALSARTGRPVILYASKWTQWSPLATPEFISMTAEDMQGFMEVIHGLPVGSLDFILDLPGGSAEATASLVSYVRAKFNDVRVFVPHAAMSAATMFACSANRIVMGLHSFLGPIDPQFILQTELGRASIAAYAIEEQFALAKDECQKSPSLLPAWLPILRQYGPALIVQCRLARQMSESFVADWLARYMFANSPTSQMLGKEIAGKLADHADLKSHNRFLDREKIKSFGLIVDDLEADQATQDDVLSVFHATMHTFNGSGCMKIIENNLGKTWMKTVQQQIVMQPPQISFPQPTPQTAPPPLGRP